MQNQEQFRFDENVMYRKPNDNNEQEGKISSVQLIGKNITTIVC